MAKARTQKPRKEQRVPPDLKAWFRNLCQRGIVGILLVSLAVVTVIGLLYPEGSGFLGAWWSRLLLQAFGWGSYVVLFAVTGLGSLLVIGKMPDRKHIPWHVIVGIEIALLALLSLTHLSLAGSDPWQAAQAGKGGGYIGAVFSGILNEFLGPAPAYLVLGVVLIWGSIVASGLTFEEWVERFEEWGRLVRQRLAQAVASLSFRSVDAGGSKALDAAPKAITSVPVPPTPAVTPTLTDSSARPKRARPRKIVLPPLDLLSTPSSTLSDADESRERAKVIEQTLAHFGVPAEVIEINPGPMVTQFGVEPGYVTRRGQDGEETERKVRVAKIASLSNDLALALSAAPIRIEAPVPGRAIVGIEVPNSKVSVVSLRKGMSSAQFQRRKSDLMLALGEGVAGSPIAADLAKMPHLLIAGATGSGKSVCMNAIATCLLCQNSPLTLRMIMVDPKRVEMARYKRLPHLYGQVESDVERVVGMLRWLVFEMQERYKKFAKIGARHLEDYNRRWQVGSSEYMPRIVVLIDELADLMLFAPEEVEKSICRLAQMARATGMHLVLSTQRPSVDVVTGLIKANFPARIGFAVSSGVDSRVILDEVGAETLLSKGDMLYMSPKASKLVRVQGCFVSDAEIDRVVRHWRDWATAEEWEEERSPWDDLLSEGGDPDQDDLVQQAIDIVRQRGSASASLLQRRMHIGYPRAARLIDELEEQGVIGSAESGGRARKVLDMGQEYEVEKSVNESAKG